MRSARCRARLPPSANDGEDDFKEVVGELRRLLETAASERPTEPEAENPANDGPTGHDGGTWITLDQEAPPSSIAPRRVAARFPPSVPAPTLPPGLAVPLSQ